jgi:hypothetical protein
MINQGLKDIRKLYEQYIDNPTYVYKMCDGRYIVIMKKIPFTKTNEKRKNIVDIKYAKCRANCLEVCVIFNVNHPSQKMNHVINIYRDKKLKYEVDTVVFSDKFDDNPANVCSSGIHYFTDIDAAYYYRERPYSYSGPWFRWYEDGQKKNECAYIDGKKTGFWIEWHANGQKKCEGDYLYDKKVDFWTEWYYDGHIKSEGEYLYDKKTCHWSEWDFYGQKDKGEYLKSSGKYLDGKRTGCWIQWYCNGQKWQCQYLDGVMIDGSIEEWNQNGKRLGFD